MTASNDSLNSAFTDSSDRNSQKAIPPDFEVDQVDPPLRDDDSGAAAVQELSPNNDSSFTRAAADDDEDRVLPTWQTSVETAENDDAVEEECLSKENPDTSAMSIDDQAQTPANCDVQSSSLENVDDVTGPDDDVEKLESSDTMPENTDTDPDLAGEVCSPADDASPSLNLDKPSAGELVDEEEGDEEVDKESWGRLSQREDSGIVNAEVHTPRSSGDQPLSSSSSGDGEVTMLHEAQVIVHVSADATSTDEVHNVRTSRRRPSADSTDRYRFSLTFLPVARVVVSVSTSRSRDGLAMYQRLVSVSGGRRLGLVSVSAIYVSCPRPIFGQIVQATVRSVNGL